MRSYLIALGVAAASLALAACGSTSLKQSDLNGYVEEHLPQVLQSDPGSVTADCPKDVEAKKGKTFDCKVTTDNAGSGTVTLHVGSKQGDKTLVVFGAADVHLSGGSSSSSGGGSGGSGGYSGYGGYGGYGSK
jgi:Domain of unknown function (DUF4333)